MRVVNNIDFTAAPGQHIYIQSGPLLPPGIASVDVEFGRQAAITVTAAWQD